MPPTLLIIVLFAIGGILLLGELLLPTQGILGVLGVGAILFGIGKAFFVNQWLGLGLLVATLLATPFVITAAINLWPRTPLGRRLILGQVDEHVVHPPRVGIGQTGVVVSPLRPLGLCEFAGDRHEARADTGEIEAGASVRVVSIDGGRIVVRAKENA
jgi:membrane-bound ClpP family serine protease